MQSISYKRHRFPSDTIRLAVWLYYRFTMNLRDVENVLAERGIDVSYETVRCWANKFGPAIAANTRRARGRADSVWHLDEMVVRINGKRMLLWRAVGKEGEVLDVLVQKRQNKAAALKLLRKFLKNQGAAPEAIMADGLRSYKAAMKSWAARIGTDRVDCAIITGWKIHTCRCDDESERCSASSPKARLNGSFPATARSTIPSPSSVTSLPETRCAASEITPWRSGTLHPPRPSENHRVGPIRDQQDLT